jgi:hypothetical protein
MSNRSKPRRSELTVYKVVEGEIGERRDDDSLVVGFGCGVVEQSGCVSRQLKVVDLITRASTT